MVAVAVITSPNGEGAPDSVPRRVFEAAPDVEIEVESVVPLAGSAIPYFWVWGDDLSTFEEALDSEPQVSDGTRIQRVEGGALYRIEWDVDSPVVDCIQRVGGSLMEAHGTAERWKLTVWFEAGDDASAFLECCNAAGVQVKVERFHSIGRDVGGEPPAVTPAQREALVTAYENGYFEGPRAITQTELADRLGVSTAAAGRRLRRGVANLVERQLIR